MSVVKEKVDVRHLNKVLNTNIRKRKNEEIKKWNMVKKKILRRGPLKIKEKIKKGGTKRIFKNHIPESVTRKYLDENSKRIMKMVTEEFTQFCYRIDASKRTQNRFTLTVILKKRENEETFFEYFGKNIYEEPISYSSNSQSNSDYNAYSFSYYVYDDEEDEEKLIDKTK